MYKLYTRKYEGLIFSTKIDNKNEEEEDEAVKDDAYRLDNAVKL